jgi:hypothetical protein
MLQQAVDLIKDKESTITGTSTYNYVTQRQLWDTIKATLDELSICVVWRVTPSSDSEYNLITEVCDVETDEKLSSTRTLSPVTVNKSLEKNGVTTITSSTDFRSTGAQHSYWCRMDLMYLLGLVSREDELAEEGWGDVSDSTSASVTPTNKRASKSQPLY